MATCLTRLASAGGIDERSLFVGPESRVRKYTSPELIEWFESHPRSRPRRLPRRHGSENSGLRRPRQRGRVLADAPDVRPQEGEKRFRLRDTVEVQVDDHIGRVVDRLLDALRGGPVTAGQKDQPTEPRL